MCYPIYIEHITVRARAANKMLYKPYGFGVFTIKLNFDGYGHGDVT